MGLRQLLKREEQSRRRQREKGRQEYRGERATREIRLRRRGRAEQRAQKTRVGPGQGGHAVEEDAAKYSKEHAKRDVRLSLTRGTERKKQRTQRGLSRERANRNVRLRRRGRWGRRVQSTRGRGGAGVGAGKGEGVCGTPEGVRGAGNINWRERGGGWVGASPQKKTYVGFPEDKKETRGPRRTFSCSFGGVCALLRPEGGGGEMSRDRASPRQHHPGDRLTRDHVGLPGAWVDTRRFHSDRCRDDRDGRRKRKGGVHKWGESAAQRGAVVQSEMLGGTRWKRVGWGRVAGENPSGSSAEWSAQVGATQSGVLGESVGNGRMRKPIRGVMVMVMVRVWVGWRKGRGKCSVECWGEQCWKRVGWGRGEVVGDDPPEVTQCGVVREAVQRKVQVGATQSEVLGVRSRSRDLLLLWGRLAGEQVGWEKGGRALSGAFPPSGEAGEEGREGGRREGHFHSNVTRETEELGEELEESLCKASV
ncbi:hypothetical protein PMAC_000260 [Pneumocystis sp. 'macacae']|nr:hypothetical protein PMAC_000260 [Pneumocystis sp. 'macacae']